jgi:hypothetical protein
MTQQKFLEIIAIQAYSVGFGAKKNFSSFDLVNKLPSWVGYISLAIGVIQLGYPEMLYQKSLSILLVLASSAILYVESFKSEVSKFDEEGKRLTQIFNKYREMYYNVKSDENYVYQNYKDAFDILNNDLYKNTIAKQVFMSQWFAHYKFFYEHQIKWVDEELHFTFFKDKIPSSLKFILLTIVLTGVLIILNYYGCFRNL